MVSKTVQVINPMGMHMRPAQLFIKTITPFACDVTILANGQEINAKSIMPSHIQQRPSSGRNYMDFVLCILDICICLAKCGRAKHHDRCAVN